MYCKSDDNNPAGVSYKDALANYSITHYETIKPVVKQQGVGFQRSGILPKVINDIIIIKYNFTLPYFGNTFWGVF